MSDVLILSEASVPATISDNNRWPDLTINAVSNLQPQAMALRLREASTDTTVIVNSASPEAVLTDALQGFRGNSIEVQFANPHRHPDGTPDLSATPLGADALICGLGDAAFETALSLIAGQDGTIRA